MKFGFFPCDNVSSYFSQFVICSDPFTSTLNSKSQQTSESSMSSSQYQICSGQVIKMILITEFPSPLRELVSGKWFYGRMCVFLRREQDCYCLTLLETKNCFWMRSGHAAVGVTQIDKPRTGCWTPSALVSHWKPQLRKPLQVSLTTCI